MNPQYINQQPSQQRDVSYQNFQGGNIGPISDAITKGPPKINTPTNNNANVSTASLNNYVGQNQQKSLITPNQEVINKLGMSSHNGASQISPPADNKQIIQNPVHQNNNQIYSNEMLSQMPRVQADVFEWGKGHNQQQTAPPPKTGQPHFSAQPLTGSHQPMLNSYSGHSSSGPQILSNQHVSNPTSQSLTSNPSSRNNISSVATQDSLLNQQVTSNVSVQNQISSGQSSLPVQTPALANSFDQRPPTSNQHSSSGQAPIIGQNSLPIRPAMAEHSFLSNQSSSSGFLPMSGQQPVHSQNSQGYMSPLKPPPATIPSNSLQHPSLPVQPPLPGQPLLPRQPSLPGQLQQASLPGQSLNQPPTLGQPSLSRPPMPGQTFSVQNSNQHYNQVRPPMPGNISNQMQQMSLSGQPRYPPMPAQVGMQSNSNLPSMPINAAPPPMPSQPAGFGSPTANTGPYPPMGGQPPFSPQQGYGQPGFGTPAYQQQQAQANRRLDPDQMPNPIQVTLDDQINRSGPFVTNQIGLLPPLVTTSFVVQDQGNASPRFIRSTMYNIPTTQDIMKSTQIPFSLVISPMARIVEQENPPPIVNFGPLGPVRCIRCKAYMCPYMNFVDSGRRFQCIFCKATTDVPAEYFQHLDHTGQRMDRFERPELVLGTYEFLATAEYCRNNILPKPPAFIFVIDVSYNSIKSGLVHLLCQNMKQILKNLPVDEGCSSSNMKVGFITFDSSVHFYNIKGSLAAPQVLIVGDTQDMFMPLLDGFLASPEESESIIDALMEQIPTMFSDTKETETVLLPAIVAGLEALKASGNCGKLLVFNSSLPTAEAPGKLKNRDDRKLLGTDKERTILNPQNQTYNSVGQDCVQNGCSVDLFLFNNSYIDIATIGQVSRLSGGEVYKYTYFQADIDGDRLVGDIIMDISKPIAFDAIMRVRTSTGIRPTEFYGHFFMSNTTDIELGSIDCDKAIGVEIKHDDKLQEGDGVYIQAALLYTSCSGQRRLRICNLSLKTCSQMADIYRACELDTLINYFSKQTVFKLLDNNPKAVKDALVNRAAHILSAYRKNCAGPSSAGQLILPECMKLLPLYLNCMLKSDAISGGSDMTVDDRSFVMQAVLTMDVQTSMNYFYPRLLPLHEIEITDKEVTIPDPIRVSFEKMNERGVYLLENGIHFFIWVGLGADTQFIQKIFGVPNASQINIEHNKLPDLDNPTSNALRNLIEEIRIQRHRFMRLTLVRQGEKLEAVYKHFLVEDRGTDGSPSYIDFLCHMHKEIRSILS